MMASAGLGQSSSSPKQWKSEVMLGFTTFLRKIATDKIQERKDYREHSNWLVSVHWWAQCHTNDLGAAKRYSTHQEYIPSSDSLQLTLTTINLECHWFRVICSKERVPATNFYRTVVLRFSKLNIKARHEIRERYIFSHST